MATMDVLNATGGTETIEKPMSVENNALLAALSTKLDTLHDDLTAVEGFVDGLETLITSTNTKLDTLNTAVASTTPSPVQAKNPDYEAVAASATDQVMGATGAAGDYLSHVTIQPASTSPGNVIVKDGSTTIYTFPGGSSSVATLIPFHVPLGLTAATGFKITTGTNVSAVAVGDFT